LIELIIDTLGLQYPDKNTFVVVDEKSYIESRKLILANFNTEKKVKISIKNKTISNWYRDLKDQEKIKYTIIDPREKLKTKLKTNWLPDEIDQNPQLIITLGLLEKQSPACRVESVWDWILSEVCDHCWGKLNPSWSHFTKICNYYLEKGNKEYSNIVNEKLRKKQKYWVIKCSNKLLSNAYKWIFDQPENHSALIYEYKVLEDYVNKNEIIKELNKMVTLPDILPDIVHNLQEMSDNKLLNNKIEEKIKIHWKAKLREKDRDLNTMIEEMSGKFMAEFDVLLNFFKENIGVCDCDLEAKIIIKFKDLPDKESKLRELRDLVCPSYPKEPLSEWDFKQWGNWIIYEYFPYRWWLQRHEKQDEKIEHYCSIYCDWLYRNYPGFLNKFEPLILGISHRVKKLIKNNFIVVWVIIDNLSWEYAKYLIEALRKYKINIENEIKPKLSMLSSETTFTKPCIVSGKTMSQIYNSDLKQMFYEKFKDFNPLYVGQNLKSFYENYHPQNNVILILYNNLDELSHKPEWSIPDRNERVKTELDSFARYMGKLIKAFDDIERVKILICTDHGCTRIIGKGHKIEYPDSKIEDDLIKKHKRFIQIEDKSSINEAEWYFLKKKIFKLKENMAIAKNYKHISFCPQGYTHGGMTPEETFVPFLEFSVRDIPICKTPYLYHIGDKILIESSTQLNLKFENPNERKINNIIIELPKIGFKEKIEKMEAMESIKLKNIPIRISSKEPIDSESIFKIEGHITFYFLSKKEERVIPICIPTKKVFEREKGFEEIFED